MEIHSKADIHLQPLEDPMSEQGEPEGSWTPWDDCTGAGSWHSPGSHLTGVMLSFDGRTCDPEGDPSWSLLFLKYSTPQKGCSMLEQLMKNCSPWEESYDGEESSRVSTTSLWSTGIM
ncbi:hypothetical protein TURU_033702 [Turdus rufiventris]|nr:hypothetical protein TURU_033702 [Turdus rufiventris]